MKVYTGFKNEWDFSEVYEKVLIIDPSMKPFIDQASKIKPMTPKELEANIHDKNKVLNSLIPKIINYALDMYITNCGNIEIGECIDELYCDLYQFVNRYNKPDVKFFQAGVSNILRRNADKEVEISRDYSLIDISDKYFYYLDEYLEEKYMIEYIRKLFSDVSSKDGILSEKESKVLTYRFGLNGHKKYTLTETAKEFNLSIERIRQVEMKALRKLRHPSVNRGIRDFINPCYSDYKEKEIKSIEKKRGEELEYLKAMYIKSHLNSFSDSDYDAARNIYNSIEKEYFKIEWVLIDNKEEFVKKYKYLFFESFFDLNLGVRCNDEDIEKKVVIEFLDHIPDKLLDLNLPKNTKEKFCKLFASENVMVKEILIRDYLDTLVNSSELSDIDMKIFWRNVFTKITL